MLSNSSPWMHTRASNSELFEPLSEPEQTLNSRLHRHDETMWAADRVVASTPVSAITIPETTNEFAIKEMLKNDHGHNLTKGNIIKIFYHDLNGTTQEALNVATGGIFLYKTPNQAYQLLEDKVLLKLDWAKNQKIKSSLKKTIAFVDEGSNSFDTEKIMARMDAMAKKMDAQYKEIQSRSNHSNPNCNDDDTTMSREEEAKFSATSECYIFTMITETETQIAIIGVQAEETIITETTIDPILMINPISKNN
ncbi:hypothetical protein Tco_1490780 [Tanacetum coccineum]